MKPLVYLVVLLLAVMAVTDVYGATPITEKNLKGVWKEKSGV